MAYFKGPVYHSVAEVTGPSGFYTIKAGGDYTTVYVDQEYDGGGWACVMANRRYTAGMNRLTYANATTKTNYRVGGSNNATNTELNSQRALSSLRLEDVNIFIGLKYWSDLAGRDTAGNISIAQFSAATNGTALGATSSHEQRYRWRFSSFTSNYAFQNVTGIADETGTGSPGFVGMASSGRGLTTFDNDQDTNGGNCSTYYNNNPYWYTSCWSGNMFAGGGYIDGPYWTSSSSGYSRQYMALYIK